MRFPGFCKWACGLAVLASTVWAQTAPNITNSSFPPATLGQAYSQALTATGGTPPYAWTSSGQLRRAQASEAGC